MITALIGHTNHGRTEDTEHNFSMRFVLSVSPWPVSEIELDADLREAAQDDSLRPQP